MKSGQCPVVNHQVLLHLPNVHPLDLGCSNPVVGGVQNLHLFPDSKLGWEFQATLTFNDKKWHILLRGAWHHQQSRRDFVPFFATIGRLISWISPTWFLPCTQVGDVSKSLWMLETHITHMTKSEDDLLHPVSAVWNWLEGQTWTKGAAHETKPLGSLSFHYPLVNQHSYGKSPSSIGKSTINHPFSIAILVYQRVHAQTLPWNLNSTYLHFAGAAHFFHLHTGKLTSLLKIAHLVWWFNLNMM